MATLEKTSSNKYLWLCIVGQGKGFCRAYVKIQFRVHLRRIESIPATSQGHRRIEGHWRVVVVGSVRNPFISIIYVQVLEAGAKKIHITNYECKLNLSVIAKGKALTAHVVWMIYISPTPSLRFFLWLTNLWNWKFAKSSKILFLPNINLFSLSETMHYLGKHMFPNHFC